MRQAAWQGLVLVDPFWRNPMHLEVHLNYDKIVVYITNVQKGPLPCASGASQIICKHPRLSACPPELHRVIISQIIQSFECPCATADDNDITSLCGT